MVGGRSSSPYESEGLEVTFCAEEIKKAVWDCGSDRASGPDGFSFAFIKQFWYLLEPDIKALVDEFYFSAHFS